jgi:hypothetical protein
MMVSGITAMPVEKELLTMLIMMSIMENGLIVSAMDMVSISIIRMLNIREIGKMTLSMDMELSPGLMALTSRGTIKRVSNLDKGSIFGRITPNIKGNGKIIK